MGSGCFLSLWAMAYGHSSVLPPYEAPTMIAEKRFSSFVFHLFDVLHLDSCSSSWMFHAL